MQDVTAGRSFREDGTTQAIYKLSLRCGTGKDRSAGTPTIDYIAADQRKDITAHLRVGRMAS